MATLLGLLALTFVGVGIVGWLWITVMAFSEGETLWGIGCLLISPVSIIYGLLNFQELKIPFFMVVAGFVGRIGVGILAIAMN